MATLEDLKKAVAGIEEEESLKLTSELLAAGIAPLEIVGACREAMEVVGSRFEEGEYFLPELMMAGEILTGISDKIRDEVEEEADMGAKGELGTVVIGTVEGDIHDIGKDIVAFMLEVNGYKVVDLGVDVAPDDFVKAVQEHDAKVVGMSCLLTVAYDPMKATVEAFDKAGLRDKVKIMIGGAATDEQIREYTGADAWGKDATAAVSLAQKWIGGAA